MKNKKIIIIIALIILAVVGAAGCFYMKKNNSKTEKPKKQTEEKEQKKITQAPSPTNDKTKEPENTEAPTTDPTNEPETDSPDACVNPNEGGAEASDEIINQAIPNLEITKITGEVSSQIKDMDAVKLQIKKLYYSIGAPDSEVVCNNRITYDYNDQLVFYSFAPPSGFISSFDVVFDMKTNEYYTQVN